MESELTTGRVRLTGGPERQLTNVAENAQPACAEGFGVAGAHLSRRSGSEEGTPNAEHPTAEILRILHKWGIHTLGQLGALDKEDLRALLGFLEVTPRFRRNRL
jgi:hypothetical protein